MSVTIRCRSKHHPTAETVKSTEWLCVSLSKNILEREKNCSGMNKTLKKQAAPGCVNVHYITFHGRTVFAKDMASDLKQKLQKTKTKELQICKNKNCAYHAWGFPPLQLCRACSAKEVWLHHALIARQGESVCKRNILKICSRIFHRELCIPQELQIQRQRTAG